MFQAWKMPGWHIPVLNMAIWHIPMLNMPIWHIPILNMAHPDMEDAHVASLNKPDGGFQNKNIIIIMSKSTGVARFGPKIDENGDLGLGSGSHGLQELKKRVPGPKTAPKKQKKQKKPRPY